jgi:hypothetical protein
MLLTTPAGPEPFRFLVVKVAQLVTDLLEDPLARVRDLEPGVVGVAAGRRNIRPPRVHRVARVDREVHDDLLDVPIGTSGRSISVGTNTSSTFSRSSRCSNRTVPWTTSLRSSASSRAASRRENRAAGELGSAHVLVELEQPRELSESRGGAVGGAR